MVNSKFHYIQWIATQVQLIVSSKRIEDNRYDRPVHVPATEEVTRHCSWRRYCLDVCYSSYLTGADLVVLTGDFRTSLNSNETLYLPNHRMKIFSRDKFIHVTAKVQKDFY